ncbi:MAG: VanZ family protein [Nitrospirota bacterium]|nr:VanZ family protein [Nitrospirota bacterium]
MLFIAVVIFGYMSLLVSLAVASPDIGATGMLISVVPDDWRDWAHVPAYGLLASLAIQGFRMREWPIPYAMLCGILLTVVFGLWTEVAQGSAPGREASLQDLLKDTMGGVMAAMLMWWHHRASPSRPCWLVLRASSAARLMKGTLSR